RRSGQGEAERPLRRRADGDRAAAAVRPRHRRRLSAGRLRDRQSASRLVGRDERAVLDRQRRRAGAFRVPRRPLHCGVRPRAERAAGVYGGLRRARRVARPLRAAAGEGRGHVSSRPLRPHRHRNDRGDRRQMKLWHAILSAFGGSVALIAVGCGSWVYALGPAPMGEGLDYSHVVLDRNGHLLRAYATKEGRWRLPETPDEVDPLFLKMLFAYEDKRFYAHHGVDPLAMVRAAFQLVTEGHIVSGGSTLTMQVARLLEPREHRSFAAKLRQITRALQLEQNLSKTKILSLYLALAPYGGNLEGVRAASLAYFGKEPKRLSVAEAALLVALPQAPEARRPDRNPDAAQAARDRVLDRVAEDGAIPKDEAALAKRKPVPRARKELPVLAPHASDEVVSAETNTRVHRLTIDANLQKPLEELARDRAHALGQQISVAIVAVDSATNEVRARVASADYFDTKRSGQVDMSRALRSPGSTLKPFIYGLGFEDGLIHPETLIDDRPARYGSYTPENFDLTFQGTVTVRKALQFSLNVPAIAVLDKL